MVIKRVISALLALIILFSFAACGSGGGSAATNKADALPKMGNIYLTTKSGISSEYVDAVLKADWESGAVPEQTVRIKLRGNSSQNAERQSYTVKFTDKVSLLGMEEGRKWALLGNPFDKSQIRISLAFDYAASIGLPYSSQTRLCNLWLNDRFVGIYVAIEPVSEGDNRVNINLENGDFILERDANRTEADRTYFFSRLLLRYQINEPETPDYEQEKNCIFTINHMEDALLTLDHTKYEQYLDIDSFVDFYIFEEVVKDIDFGSFSTRYFVQDGIVYAGPPWDLDLSMGNVSSVVNEDNYRLYHNIDGFGDGSGDSTQGFWAAQKDYYKYLCQDEYFMELVRARWQTLLPVTENLVKDNGLGTNQIDRYMEAYGETFRSTFDPDSTGWASWYTWETYSDNEPADTYEGSVEKLQSWLEKRIDWLDGQWSAEK